MTKFFPLLLFLVASVASSEPENPQDYVVFNGDILNIPNEAVIEGSLAGGGKQPDYVIDISSPGFRPLVEFGEKTKSLNLSQWQKIARVKEYVRSVFKKNKYQDLARERINDQAILAEQGVSFAKYISCGTGACREHAIATHLTLKASGIKSYYVYAKVEIETLREDHAFVIVEHQGHYWTVDAYNQIFDGLKLTDLVRRNGVPKNAKLAPDGLRETISRKILRFNSFPRIWIKKSFLKQKNIESRSALSTCRSLLQSALGKIQIPKIIDFN